MKKYEYLDDFGTFRLENAANTSYLYFPLAAEEGIKNSITPNLGGDSKLDQNHFLLQPVSVEELHNNKNTRNFWCIMSDGSAVSLAGVSAETMSKMFTKDEEECTVEAGMLWHKVSRTHKEAGLSSEIMSFVPIADGMVEIMMVTVKNDSDVNKTFSPVGAIPIYGRSADNLRDHRHVTSLLHRLVTVESGVELTPTFSFDERGHQLNDTTYYVYGATENGEKPVGFYPCVEDYIGEGGNMEHPAAIYQNLPPVGVGVEVDGYEVLGGIRFAETTLAPGASATYILLLGMNQKKEGEECAEKLEKILNKYNTKAKVEDALTATKEYWKKKLNVTYRTADKNFDNFMYWVNFQPMLRRIFGCSFLPHHDYGRGGRGWRDLWQDCLALLIMNPDGVREMLLANYGGVRIDGSNATIIGSNQGEFIADRNNITRVWMDHGLWPLMTTKLYIDQTGDVGILLKNQKYFKDRQVARGTKKDEEFTGGTPIQMDAYGKEYEGTILEHILIQNLTCFYEVGSHNHMRLRGADWNDALDMAADNGESVAFTAAYAGNFEDLARLLTVLKETKMVEFVEVAKEMEPLFADDVALYDSIEKKLALLEAYEDSCIHTVSGEKVYLPVDQVIESMKNKAEWLKDHIRKTEWIEDGADGWFNSYYDNSKQPVEGIREDGVRMMLTGQVFTIMSGTATDGQVRAIAASADKYLYKEEVGGYRLNTNFHELKRDLGRMFAFAYGHKENGAVFSHMTTMYGNALYKRGFVKEGYKALNTLYKQADNFEVSRIYPGIPEYFSDKGRGLYHYLTGSASWLMLTVITEMFGVKGNLGDLVLEPKLTAEQFDADGKASIQMNFGRRRWNIIYINKDHKEAGDYKIGTVYLDGKQLEIPDNHVVADCAQIQKMDASSEHEIVVELI